MFRFFRNLLPVLLPALSACVSNNYYDITYKTEPEGASIICDENNRGYSPVKLQYWLDEGSKSDGVLRTHSCKAIWQSGHSSIFDNTYDLNKYPNGVITTITRGSGKGYDQDVKFAARISLIRALTGNGNKIPIEYEDYLSTGDYGLFPFDGIHSTGSFITVNPTLFYEVETGSYTTSTNPHIAPHSDPHVLPHLVPHVAPHWESHHLPHLLPHQH